MRNAYTKDWVNPNNYNDPEREITSHCACCDMGIDTDIDDYGIADTEDTLCWECAWGDCCFDPNGGTGRIVARRNNDGTIVPKLDNDKRGG